MDGSPQVVELLNAQLAPQLTALDQYVLHAAVHEHRGLGRLASWTRSAAAEAGAHADQLTRRVLVLGGEPDHGRRRAPASGGSVEEQLRTALGLEHDALPGLRDAIATCRGGGDIVTALLLEDVLVAGERRVVHLETELGLLEQLGTPLHLAGLRSEPAPPA